MYMSYFVVWLKPHKPFFALLCRADATGGSGMGGREGDIHGTYIHT